MLEVPALLWQLPALLQRVDFLSVGTNDLAQFVFACDRGNPLLAERYDLLSPPMLALLRHLVRECAAAGRPLSICGEMAGNPIEAMVLIALGFRTAVDGRDRDRAGQDDDPQPRCGCAGAISRRDRRPSRSLAATLVRSLRPRPRRRPVGG